MGLIAWRSVVRHKARSGFLALCVVIGVAFVAGTFVLTDSMKSVYTRLFDDAYKGVSLSVRTRSELGTMDARSPIPAAVVDTIRAVPDVRLAEGGVFTIGGRIFDTTGKAVGNQFAPTFLASWSDEAELSSFTLIAGHAPSTAGEVVLDAEAISTGKLSVGQMVRVQTPLGVSAFRLVGVAKFGTAGNMGGASVVLFDVASAQQQTNRVGEFDTITVAASAGVAPGTLQDRVQAVIGPKYEALTGTQLSTESAATINDNLSFFATFLLVFAAISLFVGAFIVFNTFAIVVAQRTKEMALLRALGADGRQVIGSILVESLLIGFVASMIGLVGGVGLALGLRRLLGALGFKLSSGPVAILPRTIVVSLLGGVLVTVIAAITPALRASRIPPLAAVRTVSTASSTRQRTRAVSGLAATAFGVAATVAGVRAIALQWLGLGAAATVLGVALLAPSIVTPFVYVLATPIRWFRGVSGQLAQENAARSRQRTATTASALMIGTALIASALVLASSIATSTDKILAQGLRADLIVSSSGIATIGAKTAAAIRATPGVATVASYRNGAWKLGDATKQVSAMDGSALNSKDPQSSLDLDVTSGSIADVDNGGVAVSSRVAKDHNWVIGDTIAMVFASGARPQRIVAIFETTVFGDYMISLATHADVYPDSTDTIAFVRVMPSTSIATVQSRITTVLAAQAPGAKVQDRDQYAGQIRAQVSQMLTLISALVLLAIVIALLGVLITMLLSVYERTHELGLLRAVGMDRSDVRSMVRWEAAIIATFGAVLGVVLGIALGYALTRTLREQGISTIEVPYRSLLIMIIAVTLAGVGASLYPARRAGKLNVLQAIASD